jgi:serine/threonine protein kinase
MSPEQALARHGLVDHRTDVYSLGVTLYELLAGKPVIDGKDREQILTAIVRVYPHHNFRRAEVSGHRSLG